MTPLKPFFDALVLEMSFQDGRRWIGQERGKPVEDNESSRAAMIRAVKVMTLLGMGKTRH